MVCDFDSSIIWPRVTDRCHTKKHRWWLNKQPYNQHLNWRFSHLPPTSKSSSKWIQVPLFPMLFLTHEVSSYVRFRLLFRCCLFILSSISRIGFALKLKFRWRNMKFSSNLKFTSHSPEWVHSEDFSYCDKFWSSNWFVYRPYFVQWV